MKQLPALLILAFVRLAAAQTNQFEAEIQAFEASDRTNPPPANAVLFVGSSSIRLWKTLAKDFPEHRVINRGFGGSEIADSVHFADRVVIPYKPAIIVMYAGGNDINAGKRPEIVLHDFQQFVRRVHAALPETSIAYISIAPNPARWSQVAEVREANRLIEEYTRTSSKLSYIDAFSHMLGSDGLPQQDIFSNDRLHMNERGYELWTRLVREHLVRLRRSAQPIQN